MKVAKFGLSLFGVNSYIVYDPATLCCAIIDPGIINDEELNAMTAYIERNHLKVTNIINTHLHIDHAIGDDTLRDHYKVPVLAHPLDAPLGRGIARQAAMFGLPISPADVVADQPLEQGDVVKIGDGRLEVLHVPGHSPGSIALYDPDGHFVITGDALFAGSIGRTDLQGGDHHQLLDSISSRLFTLPDDTEVYPGHGPATTIGREKSSNPFF